MLVKAPTVSAAQLSLADFTDPGLIRPDLRERDIAGAIKELTQLLHAQGCVPDVLPFYNAALTREYLSSTATENGLAFPHARSHSFARLRFAFGRSPEPFAWGTPGKTLVQFVFVVVAPTADSSAYLHLLSGLAKLGKSDLLLAELRKAKTSECLWAIFKKFPLRIDEASQLAIC
jgi:nitrogen PTS system EIIA component